MQAATINATKKTARNDKPMVAMIDLLGQFVFAILMIPRPNKPVLRFGVELTRKVFKTVIVDQNEIVFVRFAVKMVIYCV